MALQQIAHPDTLTLVSCCLARAVTGIERAPRSLGHLPIGQRPGCRNTNQEEDSGRFLDSGRRGSHGRYSRGGTSRGDSARGSVALVPGSCDSADSLPGGHCPSGWFPKREASPELKAPSWSEFRSGVLKHTQLVLGERFASAPISTVWSLACLAGGGVHFERRSALIGERGGRGLLTGWCRSFPPASEREARMDDPTPGLKRPGNEVHSLGLPFPSGSPFSFSRQAPYPET